MRLGVKITPFSAGLKGARRGGIAMAGVAMIFGVISRAASGIRLISSQPRRFRVWPPQAWLNCGNSVCLGWSLAPLSTDWDLLVGVLYAVMLPMFPRKAFWWAGVSAPILWSGVIASMLGFVNPALADRIDWRWFVASQLLLV